MSAALDEILKTKKVLVCCGSGGVGKTTISASLGVRAAELGLKVLVLTIDPARRLMTSLGLKSTNEEVRVAPEKFPGELYAAMLDMKRTFDEFIMRLAPSNEVAQQVLKNHVYQQLSTALNGSQEYTALEKLLQAVSSGRFDLVILDTPPTKHAIDFLNAPTKIYTLFQESIIKWFLVPFTTIDKISFGIINRGTRAAFRAFENIAGSEFLSDLTDFFAAIRDWQKILRERTAEVHRLLTSSQAGFVLVTAFDSIKIEEAKFFNRELMRGGYFLSSIIINRAFPQWRQEEMLAEVGQISDPTLKEDFLKLQAYYNDMSNFYSKQEQAFKTFAGEARPGTWVARLPDFDQDVYNIDSLKQVANRLVIA